MKLSDLLAGQEHHVLQGDPDTTLITAGTTFDADRVTPGSLFIAVPGHREGGPGSVPPALARGAAAVLVDGSEPSLPAAVWPPGTCAVRVPDTRTAAAVVTSRYFGEPGRQMDMVAITGTNGKTSVSYMVESVLRLAEASKVGVIGTAGSRIGDEPIPMPRSVLTTPESPDLQYLLGYMRDRGASSVVLEATSMALLTHRVDRTFIDVGVFTNLTQDHLDDHGTMADYRDAKLRLFQGLCRRAVVNADDPVGAGIVAMMPGAVTTYALDSPADYRATDLEVSAAGTRFTLHHGGHAYPASIPVPGRFSVANALATVAACHVLGHELGPLVDALERMPPVPGRLERFRTPLGTSVIVDYAHSPDSLDKVLTTIRGFARGRVITVFGCGGDRDTTKRAEMGKIAGTHSDLCVLTSDNPRNEDPEAILDQVAPGLTATGTPFHRYADRRQAIAFALSTAGPEDTILIAGKGSEPHQIVGEELLPFSDMATVRELAQP
ncbi:MULTISPECIES: UDP-N-acetylmuramoyl-L-alanyl-D-glutamate--2,6-diaminopimelate ligase [Streptomyces]|uniref:UDP-N-acetylmuramoyl-L-alanyl-D-glutamate--2, 6-diaminopimelate ligase n=1 Tax=Streptomyces TaxID=1883 RepID=UPI00226D5C6D|nr:MULTISPECIES: UDP-N-acetylmuramoyl-L-alanyl-D-glutamate--2,6-diaminopimelate ligase [unclassified Streptomyces]MCY0943822.1 UDP-N-acetylmuramoyl-L-alanyl-D-glutamate--2,6-diaminopimelate ligase [Streptomyces sp. H34-AA3]MCY0954646.1 UDP-N-acetylmuramoyl-L-alanyl-D-glutamate--2,6-diaminopimelate ligase [Streptomyces sp. H27-S2]MCZ4085720.1 UDP-N-acetylmuramoyl-L-alanyl-D-glutamate--2,6-diaminopimelate ligase [Streptomyces sp. H34-S5]